MIEHSIQYQQYEKQYKNIFSTSLLNIPTAREIKSVSLYVLNIYIYMISGYKILLLL